MTIAWGEIQDDLERITKSDRWKEVGRHAAFMFFPNCNTSGLSIIDGGAISQQVDAGEVNMKLCDIPRALSLIAQMVRPPKPEERKWKAGDVVEATEGGFCEEGTIATIEQVLPKSSFKATILKGRLRDGQFPPGKMGFHQCGWRNLSIEAEKAGE
jgi:hypothetical protein